MPADPNGLWNGVRRLARAVRHGPDRLLHGWRRQRTGLGLPAKRPRLVLFVCYGNICRSPYAEAAFRRLVTDEEVAVQSGGSVGPGREVPEKGQRVALRRGLNLSAHRSRQLTPGMVQSADLVVVMTAVQRRWMRQRFGRGTRVVLLGDFDPVRIDTRSVLDPVDRPEAVFEAVYTRIDRCLVELARAVGERGSADELPLPAHGIGTGNARA